MAEINDFVERRATKSMPDPTVLTTEALAREVAALKELIDLRMDDESEARVAADEYAMHTISLQADLRGEKFQSIDRELVLIERQRVEQKKDTKDAVDAALAAAKEAVKEQTTASGLSIAKSETATNEQLKQLNQTFSTAIAGVDRNIGDLKDRIARSENTLATHMASEVGKGAGMQQSWGILLGAIGGIAGILSIIGLIIALVLH